MSGAATTARRKARELAFRVIYQADLIGDPIVDVWAQTRDEQTLSEDQTALIDDVVQRFARQPSEVDAALQAAAEHWQIERLAATDRAVLRSAVAELMARPGSPARVVIDEAIEIAKRFGSDSSGGFVNGVLDRAARALRPGEFDAAR